MRIKSIEYYLIRLTVETQKRSFLVSLELQKFIVYHKTLPPIDFIDVLLTISCKMKNLDSENKSFLCCLQKIYTILLM